MAEESKIVLSSEDQSLGTIQISPRVLEIIAGIAASEIDGVSKMYGSFANSVSELLGRSDRRRGVKLSSNDKDLSLDAIKINGTSIFCVCVVNGFHREMRAVFCMSCHRYYS